MAMIKYISITTVYVSDLDKARDFYANSLGFEVIRDDADSVAGFRWLQVGPKGAQTSISLYPTDNPAQLGQFSGLFLVTDDMDTTYRELAAKGVNFHQPPTERPYGIEAKFVDQDNTSFVLLQPRG
jgi:predicted enzyme related to lactoylglutathione lyase